MNELLYCVACQNIHTAPVAVAINDRCQFNEHTRACIDNSFLFHAATGGDADCICAPASRDSHVSEGDPS